MGHPSPLPGGTQVEIVVPVRNEERELTDHVTRLLGYLHSNFPCSWLVTVAAVAAYMDVDLSTDLRALFPLVAPLLSGHSDVAIGSRLARGARVARGLKREIISRGYNLMLRIILRVRFSDAQCGFKAVRSDAARALLPLPVLLDETIGGSAR
jgi:hypothetical protein